MALTKAQVSLVTVAALGVAPGGYAALLQGLNSQNEVANLIASDVPEFNQGTNAEFVNTVAKNLGASSVSFTDNSKIDFLKALNDGVSRADALVEFANTQLVQQGGKIANVEKATASTSTSMDLNALKLEVTPAVNAQEVTFETTNKNANGDFSSFKGSDLKANLGKAQIEKGESIISSDFTFNLKDQANVFTAGISTVGEFTGAFLSPMLERAAATQSDSAIYIKLLDGFAVRDGYQSIERLATNGVGFTIDGELVIVADKPTDVDENGISTGAIYNAKNYVELKDALTARIAELAAEGGVNAKLANFTVELGTTFTKTNQAGQKVSGTELVIKDSAGSTLEPKGFNTFGGIHPFTDLNSINELTNQAPAKNTQLISTNINAENVGYGSQGATLNIAGQSASKKGVEQFKVTAEKDVWFTRLESRDLKDNQHLQEVLLETGSNGYFNVGTQNKGNSLVALVDQDFNAKTGGGLVDVLRLDAAAANSTSVNAFISDKVIARNFNLKDTDSNYKADDVQINYSLTGGNDVLQLAVASEVLAYADTQVSINAGGGNDLVHLKVVDNALKAGGLVENADVLTKAYGKGWLANQQLNNNIEINANGGNNVIWTEGSGNARINTGNGDDTIYADNSGRTGLTGEAKAKVESLGMGADVNALFVLNAENATIGNILSNTANPTDGKGNNAQVFNTFKNTVAVSFKGFETKYVEIESTDYKTNTQQINQAIKEAILEDATLNKLLTVKEFPGNVLVIESMIDGVQKLTDLKIDFVAPAKADTTATSTPALAKGQIALDSNDLTDAAKAYAKAGTLDTAITAVTVANLAGVTGTFKGIYDLDANGAAKQYATGDAGADPLAAAPTVADNVATFAAGTDGELTFVVNATTGIDTAGTIKVGGVDVVVAATDTTNLLLAPKIAVAFNALTDTDTVTFTTLGAVPKKYLTITEATGTLTIKVNAAWLADNAKTVAITNTLAVVDGTPATNVDTTTGIAAPSITAATGTTAETQTIAFGAASGAGKLMVGGVEVTLDGTETTGAAVATKVEAALKLATTINGVDYGAAAGTKVAVGTNVGTDDHIITIEYPALAGDVPAITFSQSGPATVINGKKSDAHSDNVINAGGGNDVIVLGTGDYSNDTVVLTGTFGKTTIVNFDSVNNVAAEAVNGGDLLDFRTYLDANIGDATVGQVKLDATTGAAVAANAIKIVDFTTIKAGTASATNVGGIAAAEKLGDVTAAQLSVELNSKFNASLEATKNVFLIHNNSATGNDGEYLVVTATSTKGAAAVGTGTGGDTFNEVTIVGTLDFGAAQSFAGNIVGFDGVIV